MVNKSEMLLSISLSYLFYGLVLGFVVRTIEQKTKQEVAIEYAHPHLLTLGFIFHLLLFAIIGQNTQQYLIALIIYNIGLLVSSFSWYFKTLQQLSIKINNKLIIILSGIGHILMSVGVVWLMIELLKVFS